MRDFLFILERLPDIVEKGCRIDDFFIQAASFFQASDVSDPGYIEEMPCLVAAEGAVLHYTTRAADGAEQEHAVPAQELSTGPAEGGTWLQLPAEVPIAGDSIRLAEE